MDIHTKREIDKLKGGARPLNRKKPEQSTSSILASKSKQNSLLLLEANLKSKQNMIKERSKTNKKSSEAIPNIPPQHSQAEPWERECDLTSDRYRDGEYIMDLDVDLLLKDGEIENERNKICIDENVSRIGTRVWDCSFFMIRWFEHMKRSKIPMCQGRSRSMHDDSQLRILELGAGTGLLSIALSKLLEATIVATEYGPIVSHLIKNCARNDVLFHHGDSSTKWNDESSKGKVVCLELDWYRKDDNYDLSSPLYSPFHVVVVCDCTLTPNDSEELVKIMKKFALPETVFYVGLCREREGTPIFWKLVKDKFDVEILTSLNMDVNETDSWKYKSKRHTIARLLSKQR